MNKQTVALVLLLVFVASSSARFIKVINRCPHNIMVRTLGNAGLPTLGDRNLGGYGASTDFHFADGWSGRLWGNNSPGATLFEISTSKDHGFDYYDISIIDGYNFAMVVRPLGGGGAKCRQFNCWGPGRCEGYEKPDDDRRREVVSACKGSNFEVTFCPWVANIVNRMKQMHVCPLFHSKVSNKAIRFRSSQTKILRWTSSVRLMLLPPNCRDVISCFQVQRGQISTSWIKNITICE